MPAEFIISAFTDDSNIVLGNVEEEERRFVVEDDVRFITDIGETIEEVIMNYSTHHSRLDFLWAF